MQTVTIRISDEDYNDMVEHLATEHLGRINVAVIKLVAVGVVPQSNIDAAWLEGEWCAIQGEQEGCSDHVKPF